MNYKEKLLAAKLLDMADLHYSNHGCNDVDDSFYEGWTIEERRTLVKEYYEWNKEPGEYNENYLHLPDFCLMGLLSHKLKEDK